MVAVVPKPTLQTVFELLFQAYGPQNWWPGDSPFEIMVGAVLTQNTSWTNVEKAIGNLKQARLLTPQKIIASHHKSLATHLKPSGYFNIKTKRLKSFCQWLLNQGGEMALARRETEKLRIELLSVHGIGPETADDILLYALDRPVFVIDAYTRRIFQRLGLIGGDEPYEQLRKMFEQGLGTDIALFNEYHALIVLHGKDICRKQPRCEQCCLQSFCSVSAA
ncbi:MAG: endonuclease III domain-containing protein [Gammaproteobacteria bacterium]|nr:endonuclease III domain-containing protein [Gammaproteobacteria bacterium]